ncbi:RNA polymerase I-specific transcription initiation factor RRN3 [Yarrowia lipolytica]|uniref:RNA polymerase I-specific transcription initiation factor RRN3 n=1 Tax=Yarrowia lipolytica TaxID=4952 RepID=A0A1H6Q7G0_YARLL|nr:hypothetical protein YALI1_D35575g [Yarrowia lipolytica]KAB8283976.1 RNA polymerase I-specific transcription initiation factor RRN3 [Yarrowia lipolytica]KAE8172155.1 RNA polymerase I-specific transcription initiation factor RRN3 [Yarrowia lipolytica]KAJ8053870.1 RNA polymerase I-specific transcription initiation factor RRN3 [Yarrowia lipolytica]RDW46686.1 RNA polymerase I-specific transcription initiation factor RRN3 [Yarrowia lipolytica]
MESPVALESRGLSLKRKRVDSPQVMALKKPRDEGGVLPQDDGKLTTCPETGDLSAGVYKAFVKNALDEVEKQNYSPLGKLTDQITKKADSPDALSNDQLTHMIQALSIEISRLDSPRCSKLINGVVRLHLEKRQPSQALTDTYYRFLAVLVSAVPRWWSDVATQLVADFTLDDASAQHSALRYMISITPTSATLLQGMLLDAFPNKMDTTARLCNFIRNALITTEYCPALRNAVWGMVVEKSVQIDVELQDELDEMDEEELFDAGLLDAEDPEVVDLDDATDIKEGEEDGNDGLALGDSDDELDDDDDDHIEVNDASSVGELLAKLDGIVSLLLMHVGGKFNDGPEEITTETVSMYASLINVFKTYLLPTHRTRFVQYIVFQASQACPEFMDAFLASLIEITLSSGEGMDKRSKAMQYIASYIARAKHLSKAQIVFVVSMLTGWIDRYVSEREAEVNGVPGSMERFKTFYSVVQGLMYIFCFRNEMLRLDSDAPEGDSVWECKLDKFFQRIIMTKFNPLQYCNHSVVAMFAKIAHHHDAAYCFTIIDENKRGIVRKDLHDKKDKTMAPRAFMEGAATLFDGPQKEFTQLEGYFPFDPLLLKRSRSVLGDLYIEWSEVAEDLDSDSEDGDESDGGDHEDDMEEDVEDDDE